MTNTIDNLVQDKQEIKYQLSDSNPDVVPAAKIFNEEIIPQVLTTKIETKGITGAFILNSSVNGVLGTDTLGDGGNTTDLWAVLPYNNIHIEHFGQNNYIDTSNSTGTIDTSNETYTLDAGEILQTEIIYKPRGSINSVKILNHEDLIDTDTDMLLGSLQLGITTFDGDTVSVEFSNDGGTTWFEGKIDEVYTFATTTSDDELVVKITSIDSVVVDKPLYIQVS